MSDGLVALGRWLQSEGYAFTPVTPATHMRVLPRHEPASDLRDIFGWNARFDARAHPRASAMLLAADACERSEGLLKSRVRIASYHDELFIHSAFPTLQKDSVFFGPDTYRFLRALTHLQGPLGRLADIGTGSGVAGLHLAPRATETLLCDISATALGMARVNATIARREVKVVHSDVLSGVTGPLDTVIANPPFLVDEGRRTYRDGGGRFGTALSVRIVAEALQRLAAGGRLLLYTASPFVDGRDVFAEELKTLDRQRVAEWTYEEIDPDIFGEELEAPAYANVERIAAVVLSLRCRD